MCQGWPSHGISDMCVARSMSLLSDAKYYPSVSSGSRRDSYKRLLLSLSYLVLTLTRRP